MAVLAWTVLLWRSAARHTVASEGGVRPLRLVGDLPTEPVWWLEPAGLGLGVELDLDGEQAGQRALIHVELGDVRAQRDAVAHLLQPSASGVRPQLLGLHDGDRHLDLGA